MRIGHFKYIPKSCAMCLDIKSQQAIAYSHFTKEMMKQPGKVLMENMLCFFLLQFYVIFLDNRHYLSFKWTIKVKSRSIPESRLREVFLLLRAFFFSEIKISSFFLTINKFFKKKQKPV